MRGRVYWTGEVSYLTLHHSLIKASLGAANISETRLISTPPLNESGKFQELHALTKRKSRTDPESAYVKVLWIIRP